MKSKIGSAFASMLGLTVLATSLIVTMPANAASAVAAPAAIVKLLPSPYSGGAQAPNTFIGDAAEWAVGIVVSGTEALVYLCDGRNVGQWFGATIANGSLTGTAPNGSVVKAALKSGAWSGTVSLKGKPIAFAAKAATPKNGWGVWRVKPSPYDGPDYVVGWISTSKGIRGISQTPTGKVASGVVATVNASGQAILNGEPLIIPPNSLPSTTIAGQVLSAQINPTGTSVPPETTKLCLGKSIALKAAIRHNIEIGGKKGATGSEVVGALDAVDAAYLALQDCLAGL